MMIGLGLAVIWHSRDTDSPSVTVRFFKPYERKYESRIKVLKTSCIFAML
jgi:hypothetical protein